MPAGLLGVEDLARMLIGRPHLNQFEECKTSMREGPRGLQGAREGLGPQALSCPLEPPGSLPHTGFALLKLVKMGPAYQHPCQIFDA